MQPQEIHLKDYRSPDYFIDTVDLKFDLNEDKTVVCAQIDFYRNIEHQEKDLPLVLNGIDLKLLSLKIDEEEIGKSRFFIDGELLTIKDLPEKFRLEIINEIKPQENTSLEGLYRANNVFCTQNEPEGFRKITYFPDRSDVMAKYTTTITADKEKYPTLLSNGNKVASGDLENGRHYVKWLDPFKKPSYLYALVAGDFDMLEDYFTTCSGREVLLQIYVDKGNKDKSVHAMTSLKESMKWDEGVYGLEYDLDIYMIVAVDSFNMGAMENKGLNIFNSALVLARPETATDADYKRIEGVIGHEYFHNWTGNRVTCRDWFQLTLKEGLTVYRDQNFSADMGSSVVQRIEDVWILRQSQFPEDAGPNAHPIRPPSYIQINNFYTPTVYNKGAEVIRMVETLIGKENFRKGIDKYFELYDGQAVTTDDFLHAMQLASGFDFTHFKNWYGQAGTPEVEVKKTFDKKNKTYTLNFKQSCPATKESPKNKEKKPFLIPFKMGLLNKNGKELDISKTIGDRSSIFQLKDRSQKLVFNDIDQEPVLSINRHFSAPIKLNVDYSKEELSFLMNRDTDPFNRWESGQNLAIKIFHDLLSKDQNCEELLLDSFYSKAIGDIFSQGLVNGFDGAFINGLVTLPSEAYLNDMLSIPDYDRVHKVREFILRTLAADHKDLLLQLYRQLDVDKEYTLDSAAIGRRSLKNKVLAYLAFLETDEMLGLAYSQYSQASNMTDEFAALNILVRTDNSYREKTLQDFYDKWQGETLVMDKWLAVQTLSVSEKTVDRIRDLREHSIFDIKNPNKIRSLFRTFTTNLVQFNRGDGEGYRLIGDLIVELDKMNPIMASTIATAYNRYAKLDTNRQQKMKSELEKILTIKDLSKDTYEIVSKTIAT